MAGILPNGYLAKFPQIPGSGLIPSLNCPHVKVTIRQDGKVLNCSMAAPSSRQQQHIWCWSGSMGAFCEIASGVMNALKSVLSIQVQVFFSLRKEEEEAKGERR